jgi:osmotically-inducible protein OsmY
MTAPVMMVRRHHTVVQGVRLLHHFNIKHLPWSTSKTGWSASSAAATCCACSSAPTTRSTARSQQILGRPYVAGNVEVAVRVDGGVVRLEGHARTQHDLDLLVELVKGVDGVVTVDSQVGMLSIRDPIDLGTAAPDS